MKKIRHIIAPVYGEVAEWPKAAVSKTVIPFSGIGGSNPPLSAIFVSISY